MDGTGVVKEDKGGVFKEEEFDFDAMRESMAAMPTPAWEYYAAAENIPVPVYKIERARSDRGRCFQTETQRKCGGGNIEKGVLRAGNLNNESGTYGRWMHLKCWRVPSAVWLSFPEKDSTYFTKENFMQVLHQLDDVLLTGIAELTDEEIEEVLSFIMDTSHWAKKRAASTKKKSTDDPANENDQHTKVAQARYPKVDSSKYKPKPFSTTAPKSEPEPNSNASVLTSALALSSSSAATSLTDTLSNDSYYSSSGALVVKGQKWPNLPVVTHTNKDILNGKTIVMTGIFPETGGGTGLTYGKDSMKSLLTRFGARVVGSVSGKTDLLLVGTQPGMGKISEARKRGVPMIEPHEMRLGLEGNNSNLLTDVASTSLVVTNFSAGYRGYSNSGMGNSLAFRSSDADVAFAAGVADMNRITDKGRAGTMKKATPKQQPNKPKPQPTTTTTATDEGDEEEQLSSLKKMKVIDLKKKLQELDISDMSGKKMDLIDRILQYSQKKKRKSDSKVKEEGKKRRKGEDGGGTLVKVEAASISSTNVTKTRSNRSRNKKKAVAVKKSTTAINANTETKAKTNAKAKAKKT